MKIENVAGLALEVVGTCLYRFEQAPAASDAARYDSRGVMVSPLPVAPSKKVKGRITVTSKEINFGEDRGEVTTAHALLTTRTKIDIPGDTAGAAQIPLVTDTDGTRYRVHAPKRKGCVYVYPLERYRPVLCP